MNNETEIRELTLKKVEQIIEALLFASSEPLSLSQIQEVTHTLAPLTTDALRGCIDSLNDIYSLQERSFHISELGEGFLLRTHAHFHPYLDILYRKKHPSRLSKAALEVLSIIAFKGPITRAEIEEIRGVDCSSLIQTLLDRELITSAGKVDAPGRPSLYKITPEFMEYFDLKQDAELRPRLLPKTHLEGFKSVPDTVVHGEG